jgi:hypothetical protein
MRRWQRFKVDVRVKVRRSEEPDTAAVVVRSYVMSEGGMSVYAPESLEIGMHVLVEFSLPGTSRELRLRALIRNRCGFRCGMEFVERVAADRMLIRRFLQLLGSEHAESMKDAEVGHKATAKPEALQPKPELSRFADSPSASAPTGRIPLRSPTPPEAARE